MKNRIQKTFIIIFSLIIATPLILFATGVKIEPTNKGDKKISLNFKRDFPLKADLFQLYSIIKKNIFIAPTIPSLVIESENGWLFLGNSFEDAKAMSESKGLLVFTKKELTILKANLLNKKKWLDKNNIKFYIAIAPNKHSVYGEMIPIKQYNRKTKLEQVDSICNSLNIDFINLGNKFPKNQKRPLYYKTDTHWNDLGAFYGFQATYEAIKKDYPSTTFKPYTLDSLNLTVSESVYVGDLNGMLKNKRTENHFSLNFKTPQNSTILEKRLPIPLNYNKNPNQYESRFMNSINKLKIIILHDSFMPFYSKYIKENFGETLFIWNHRFEKELIQSEKPDILYYEIVERSIDILLEDNYEIK